jgi:hypothetical protein
MSDEMQIIEALQEKIRELEYRIKNLEDDIKSIKYYGIP